MAKTFDVRRFDIYMDENFLKSDVQIDGLMDLRDAWRRNGCPDHLSKLHTTKAGNTYMISLDHGLTAGQERPEMVRFTVNHTLTREAGDNFPESIQADRCRTAIGSAVGFTS